MDTPNPADLLRLSHQKYHDTARPWAQASFKHLAPRAAGPGCPAHLEYEASLVYPGTAVITTGGETVAASRPGYLDIHATYAPGLDDPYTYGERTALLAKAAALLLAELRCVHVYWPIRSGDRKVIAHGAVRVEGFAVAVMAMDPSLGPGVSDRVLAVAEPGRPCEVDEAATATAHAAWAAQGGRHV